MTILQLVILNHLSDTEWTGVEKIKDYFNSAPNLYQYMNKLVACGFVATEKRIGRRSNGRPTMFNVYRLTKEGLNVLKTSKTYLLREVISDEMVCI